MQPCRRQWGDFCPTVIFHDTQGERESGREREMGEHIRKNKTEAERWGGAFIHALPVNFDTFDRGTLCFQALLWRHQLILCPSLSLRWKFHIHCHVMRPCPVWLGRYDDFISWIYFPAVIIVHMANKHVTWEIKQSEHIFLTQRNNYRLYIIVAPQSHKTPFRGFING